MSLGRFVRSLFGSRPAESEPVESVPDAPIPEGAWNQELFEVLRDDPSEENAAVLADWLQEQGDLRGELMARQLAGQPVADLLEANRGFFYGTHAAIVARVDDTPLDTPSTWDLKGRSYDEIGTCLTRWRHGFVDGVSLPMDDADWGRDGFDVPSMVALLEHPSLRMVREVIFQGARCHGLDGLPVLPTVERLRIGDFYFPDECEMSWSELGAWDWVADSFPNLKRLHIQGGLDSIRLPPGIRELVIESSTCSGALVRSVVAQVREATRVSIWTGSQDYGSDVVLEDVLPLLDRPLEHLGIMNCEFSDALIGPLATSAALKGLTSLDLSMGTLTDVGARRLVEHADAFAHLERLNLDENGVNEMAPELQRLFGDRVSIEKQEIWDDRVYVSVAE